MIGIGYWYVLFVCDDSPTDSSTLFDKINHFVLRAPVIILLYLESFDHVNRYDT